jgi:putative ABC transport system permease protein
MLKLFKENIRIALGSIRTQLLRTVLTVLIIAIGITLVSILTVVSALENTYPRILHRWDNTFNLKQYENTTRNRGGNERLIINPISYPEAVAFKINTDIHLPKHPYHLPLHQLPK